jgi:RHS repeat-associated protein
VTHLTSTSGAIVEKYKYDAFGAPTIYNSGGVQIPSTAYNNRFLFTGREYAASYAGTYTPAFNFYEYRARAYNPTLGRFMSEDPKGFDAGDYNLFRYCHNDPLDLTDPMGLDPFRNPDGTYSHVLRAEYQDISKVTGRYVVDSKGVPRQCAGAAQFLAGTAKGADGKPHDAPSARNGAWIQGAPLTKNTPNGTMVASYWENGRYPNKGINQYTQEQRERGEINHTAIKVGWDKGKAILLDQWQGKGGQLERRPYDPKKGDWSVVNTTTASDPKRSTSTLEDAKEVDDQNTTIPDFSMLGGGALGLGGPPRTSTR